MLGTAAFADQNCVPRLRVRQQEERPRVRFRRRDEVRRNVSPSIVVGIPTDEAAHRALADAFAALRARTQEEQGAVAVAPDHADLPAVWPPMQLAKWLRSFLNNGGSPGG